MAPSTGDAIYRHLAPSLTQPTELARLSADLPGYDVIITRRGCSRRFEAIRRPGGPEAGPWCVISTDPADLWRELADRRARRTSGPGTGPPLPPGGT